MVIQESFEHMRAFLVFTNAFPAPRIAQAFARDSLMAGADSNRPAAENIYRRFQVDEEYINKAASAV
jgi:hypothetical protein